jgi:predicted  nucleic acid-binding Zn-ribbon protein
LSRVIKTVISLKIKMAVPSRTEMMEIIHKLQHELGEIDNAQREIDDIHREFDGVQHILDGAYHELDGVETRMTAMEKAWKRIENDIK